MKNGVFQARVQLLLKKSTLDPNDVSSYHPISNVPYISKLIERVVVSCLSHHMSTFNLLPAEQSAYRSFQTTESTLLSIHNNLVCAIDSGKVSLLVLLDLSAAFDTVDH